MEDIAKVISNVGFPITITLYLLIRLEKKFDRVGDSMDKLTIEMIKLQDKIKTLKYILGYHEKGGVDKDGENIE